MDELKDELKEIYYRFLIECGLAYDVTRPICCSTMYGNYGAISTITICQTGSPPRGTIFISLPSDIRAHAIAWHVNNIQDKMTMIVRATDYRNRKHDAKCEALKTLIIIIKQLYAYKQN